MNFKMKMGLLVIMIASTTANAQWSTNSSGIFYNNASVGIGTSAPAARLQVNGHLAAVSDDGLTSFVELMNFNCIVFKANTVQNGLHFVSANNLAQAGWSDKMILTDGGNLGVGTSTPAARLDVNGAIYGNAENHFSLGSGTYVDPNMGQGYAIKIGSGGLGVNGNCVFMNGNVGVGTTAPGPYKLAVEGMLGARKIVVTQANPWADYVFDSNYKLPSLDSVSAYIKANHHLQDIPSADSIAKDGIDVGNNQALLLKKIEELTLYVISLKEQNDLLQENVRLLNERNQVGHKSSQ